jgi:beta-glucosidase
MDQPITPLYPFGHGLSYTTFEYSDFTVDQSRIAADGEVTASVTVRNAGKVRGDEVVQLYARDPIATVARPVKELRGFKRLTLAPGESARVSFRLSGQQFALYGLDQQWRVEAGRIELMVGASSTDIRATGGFEIANALASDTPAAAIATAVTVAPLSNRR